MVKKGKNNMFDELIKRCIENKNYTGLIVVKNKEAVDKIDIKCDRITYDIEYGLFIKYCHFNNGSFIMIYYCEDLEGVRMIRSNYLMIKNGINKEFVEKILLCYLTPYYHYMNYGDMNDMSYDEPVVEYFKLEDID